MSAEVARKAGLRISAHERLEGNIPSRPSIFAPTEEPFFVVASVLLEQAPSLCS
jgi:hypothetical protein